MASGGGGCGVTAPCDRSLNRKSSKSRLEKQQEVEDEDPPGGRSSSREVEKQRSAVPCPQEQASTKADAASFTCPDIALNKIQIPETKVESFDNVDVDDDDDKGTPAKSKILVRSHAMCGDDDTRLNARLIEKQGSKGSAGSSLSRDSSNELYTDSTGINLEEFIINTLHKNPRDRTFLIDLEQTLVRFVQDAGKQIHRFPTMSSYNRMLVHRVAAFFGLDHNVDQSGQAVVVSKMQTTRIPDVRFRDYIKHDIFTDEPKKVLLKRDAQSYEEAQAKTSGQPFDIRKARSFEERDDEYARTRGKNFNQQDSSSSVEGVIESPVRPWSSTDSSSDQSQVSFMQLQRAQLMQKAGSFGGVATFSWSDAAKVSPRRSNTDSSREAAAFSRQPTIPEALSGPSSPPVLPTGQAVIFAVASIEQVPPGAVIINAQTGQPYLNPDGTIYRHGVLRHQPVGAAPPPPPTGAAAYTHVPSLLPYCATSLTSSDLSGSIAGQIQQLNIVSPNGASVAAESARSAMAMATPQMYFGAPHVYTYVVSQNQQQQPQQQQQHIQSQASDSSPQRLPQLGSQITVLPSSPAAAYMQPVPVQYPEPLSYQVHAGQIGRAPTPTQQSVAMANSATGYPIYYPPHPASAPVGVGMTAAQPALPIIASTGSPSYATHRTDSGETTMLPSKSEQSSACQSEL